MKGQVEAVHYIVGADSQVFFKPRSPPILIKSPYYPPAPWVAKSCIEGLRKVWRAKLCNGIVLCRCCGNHMQGRASVIRGVSQNCFQGRAPRLVQIFFQSSGRQEKISCSMKWCHEHKPVCHGVLFLARFRSRSLHMAFVECSWWSMTTSPSHAPKHVLICGLGKPDPHVFIFQLFNFWRNRNPRACNFTISPQQEWQARPNSFLLIWRPMSRLKTLPSKFDRVSSTVVGLYR